MKATFSRKYQKAFWTSGTWKVFVEYEGSTLEIDNGGSEEITLIPNRKIMKFHLANEYSIPTYSRQVVLSDLEDINFQIKVKTKLKFIGESKVVLNIKADKKIKIRKM